MRTAPGGGRPMWMQLALPADVVRERIAASTGLGGYVGGHRSRRATKNWSISGGDADEDILGGLDELRDRSRDLQRNNALAAAAINTKITSVVGAGLTLLAEPDAERLGLSDDEADRLTDAIEEEWDLFSSRECDLERVSGFAELTAIAYRSVKDGGDALVLLPFRERPGSPYGLKLQLVEADRLSNPDRVADSETIAGGVERDRDTGQVLGYHVADRHPGSSRRTGGPVRWARVPAYTEDGAPGALHLFPKRRIGQSRGVPDVAGVIEPLRQLGRYTEAELMATVISSMFTVFIKTETGEGLGPWEPEGGGSSSAAGEGEVALGNAAVVHLGENQAIETADPNRPNSSYDAFVTAMMRQICAALELPIEIVLKNFTTSYTAARAAMIEVWRYYMSERAWLVADFCQPVYEMFFAEAVARARIPARGYLRGDLAFRRAFMRAQWIGPARGQIQEAREMGAVEKRTELGITTLQEETAAINGGNWARKIRRRAREQRRLIESGFGPQDPPAPAGQTEDDESDDGSDSDDERQPAAA